MKEEIIDKVDEQDNTIGEVSKAEAHEEGLWHRASTIFVFNKKGELLVQKRSPHVQRPNKLSGSASGHLDKGESYEEGAKRELKEELGINCNIKPIADYTFTADYLNNTKDREHVKLFTCTYEGDFNLQKEELSQIMFMPIKDVKAIIDTDKVTPGFRRDFKKYLEWLNK